VKTPASGRSSPFPDADGATTQSATLCWQTRVRPGADNFYFGRTVSGAQHNLCVRRQHGTYRALSDGDFFSHAVRPPPGTKDHRILANNPFKPVIYSLATMLHSENVGHNQMDEFLRVIRHDGDRTPYSAEALRYMPLSMPVTRFNWGIKTSLNLSFFLFNYEFHEISQKQ
jgi:hypothetical protein